MNSTMRRFLATILATALSLVLAGCAVGPNYQPPNPPMPASYGQPTTRPLTADIARWWATFNDPMLESLIRRGIDSNLDLQLAQSRIRESRAARGVAGAGYWPTVDANASFQRNSRSNNTATFSGTGGGVNFGPRETDLYEVGFDSTWEIDVFGAVRRSVEAADADIQASIENRRDVLITLLGDVAQNYIVLRGRQRQLDITQANLKSQQQTLDLTQARFKAGLVGELDVARAQAQVAATTSLIPQFEQQLQQSIHRLSVLLGEEPQALVAELGPVGPIPSGVGVVPTGLPSDLLRRRADIRRAERQLAAQTARIGVATADLFPRFSLTGSLGLQSQKFSNLFENNSLFWGIGPGVTWNIFNAGRVRSNIEVQNARQEQALVTYQQTVLNSLEEVENALVAYDREQSRRVSLAQAVDANRRAVDLANQLYSRGLVDFLNVQESQRNLLVAEDTLAQSDALVSTNLVSLYKALGGGWEELEPNEKRN
jgi:NodT family efflux transporter outer membrane factor (OMF) lipoprotein